MIEERNTCILCGQGRFDETCEKAMVPSNVRKIKHMQFPVWRCGHCGCIHSLKKENMVKYYQEIYPYVKRTLDDYTQRLFNNYVRRLQKFGLTKQSSILDYGCAEGLMIDHLKKQGYHNTTGYDPFSSRYSDAAVMKSRYDVVICQDVIEHVEDPRDLMRQLSIIVKPGGILCMGTPRAEGINLSKALTHKHALHQPYHLHILSQKALTELALEQKMSVMRIFHRDSSDTIFPFNNWRFIRAYMAALDDTLNAGFDPPRIDIILKSPRLWFLGLFGGIPQSPYSMIGIFKKPDS